MNVCSLQIGRRSVLAPSLSLFPPGGAGFSIKLVVGGLRQNCGPGPSLAGCAVYEVEPEPLGWSMPVPVRAISAPGQCSNKLGGCTKFHVNEGQQ